MSHCGQGGPSAKTKICMPSRAVFLLVACLVLGLSGCTAIPDVRTQPQFHNPFPQLHRVAVLPFVNQSQEPTLDTDRITIAYHNELQKLPGFEVKPVGVVKTQLQAMGIQFNEATDFQALAQQLDVDVVILGAVTDYTPYYPPRLGMRVHWYAANPGFHPIPPGYGLPWGTAEEEYIPDRIVHEAEFALAREQLKTQTPDFPRAPQPRTPAPVSPRMERLGPQSPPREEIPPPRSTGPNSDPTDAMLDSPPIGSGLRETRRVNYESDAEAAQDALGPTLSGPELEGPGGQFDPGGHHDQGGLRKHPHSAHGQPPLPLPEPNELPPDWPDPRGFIPESPQPTRPQLMPQPEPIITHTRLYDGSDERFTQRVSEYFYFRDDARFGGWQAYLQRSDDFINVCCHFHITETLAARGGAGKSRVVWRWPIGRYER